MMEYKAVSATADHLGAYLNLCCGQHGWTIHSSSSSVGPDGKAVAVVILERQAD